jgi:hypothetical protein
MKGMRNVSAERMQLYFKVMKKYPQGGIEGYIELMQHEFNV